MQLNKQEWIKKLHQDLEIDQNEMLKHKPRIRERLKELVAEFKDRFVMPGQTVGMVLDRYEIHICLKPGAKP